LYHFGEASFLFLGAASPLTAMLGRAPLFQSFCWMWLLLPISLTKQNYYDYGRRDWLPVIPQNLGKKQQLHLQTLLSIVLMGVVDSICGVLSDNNRDGDNKVLPHAVADDAVDITSSYVY
jgi:hypothetical protein